MIQKVLFVTGNEAKYRQAEVAFAGSGIQLEMRDLKLPEMDGIELAQHLQKLPKTPVIIFTTAYKI